MPLPSLRLLTLLLPLAVALPLTGCQDDAPRSLLANGGASSGGVSFRLDSAVLAKVGTSADSLRLELRKGTVLRSIAVCVTDSVRVTDLEPGDWTLEAGLYDSARSLKWYGKTTVPIVSGTVSKAYLDLKAATGSVDVIIRLGSAGSTMPVVVFPPPFRPIEEPVLPACPTESGLVLPARDTALMAGLKLDTAFVKIVSRCDSGVWLDVTLPDAGSTPVVFGYTGQTVGPCGPVCSAIYAAFVLRVRSQPSSDMSAQVLTVKRVFVAVANGSAAILFE